MSCTLCELHSQCKTVKINHLGTGQILFILDSPDYYDDFYGKPLSGKSGKFFKEYLNKLGLDQNSYTITYAVNCFINNEKNVTKKQIAACSIHLENLILALRPKVMIPMGNAALQALRHLNILEVEGKITSLQGNLISTNDYLILPAFHPAFILRNSDLSSYEKVFEILSDLIFKDFKIDKSPCDYQASENLEDLKIALVEAEGSPLVSYDIETSSLDPNTPTSFIICFSISWRPRQAFCFYCNDSTREIALDLLHSQILENREIKKIIQHAKFEILWSMSLGRSIFNIVDTMLLHWHTDEKNGTHGLGKLAVKYTDLGYYDAPLEAYKKEHPECDPEKFYVDPKTGMTCPGSYANFSKEMLCLYNCQDSDAGFRIYNILKEKVNEKQWWIHDKIQIPMAYSLAKMELKGVNVDWEYVGNLAETLPQIVEDLQTTLFEFNEVKNLDLDLKTSGIPEGFSANSPKHICKLLYEYLNFSAPFKTAKGQDSTDKNALNYLASRDSTGLVQILLEIRKLNTLYNTFVKGIVNKERNGRIYTDYGMVHTETGRLNSRSPNLQNIPRDSLIKNIFIPEPGQFFLQCDYSQIELRVMAIFANDTRMIEYFKNEIDIHRAIASRIHQKNPEDVTKEERTMAKRTVFGLCYGQGASGLADELGVLLEEAELFLRKFFKEFKNVKKWIDSTKAFANENGYVETLFGRRRRLPDAMIKDDYSSFRNQAERQAINQPIQGTASDLLAIKLSQVDQFLEGCKSRLVLTVHDNIVFSVAPEECQFVIPGVKLIMEDFSEFKEIVVPILVEAEIGRSYGSLVSLSIADIKKIEAGEDINVIYERLKNGKER